jgi:O-antigen/teichoic acid export membrane protein
MARLMRSRLLLRRAGAAAGIYSSAALGFLATIVAAHLFSRHTFGLYAIVLAATGFFQTAADLTVEEALIKFGFRYTTREDWGRLRRLFQSAIAFKLSGGVVGAAALLVLAPLSYTIFHKHGLGTALAVASLIPLTQCLENVAGVALILHGRYDVRGFFLFTSMLLRLIAVAVGAPHGLTATIVGLVAAQALATGSLCVVGWIAYRRFPREPARPLGEERRPVFGFVAQSSIATVVTSLTTTLATLVLGRVASATQVGYFRTAMSPQQAFAAISSPARLILLTEQTRDWERGEREPVYRGIRRYMLAATLLSAALLPPLLVFAPQIVKLVFGAKWVGAANAMRLIVIAGALRMVYGWTKSFPVSIGRPNLRIWTHGVEALVLVPLTGVLGATWGATGAAGAVIASSVAFCLYWTLLYARIRREPVPPPHRAEPIVA